MTLIKLFSALVFVCPTDLTAQAQTDKGFLGLGFLRGREETPKSFKFSQILKESREHLCPFLPSDTLGTSWSSSLTPLSQQINCKHQDQSLLNMSSPHPFTRFLNQLCISHIDCQFFQNKMDMELMALKQGSQDTTRSVLKTQQLPLQAAPSCIQLRTNNGKSPYEHPKETGLCGWDLELRAVHSPWAGRTWNPQRKRASPKAFPPTWDLSWDPQTNTHLIELSVDAQHKGQHIQNFNPNSTTALIPKTGKASPKCKKIELLIFRKGEKVKLKENKKFFQSWKSNCERSAEPSVNVSTSEIRFKNIGNSNPNSAFTPSADL